MSTRRLAIAICTYHREDLLKVCLESIFAQAPQPGLSVRIIVVDNSDAGTARSMMEELAARARVPLSWHGAHPANIAVARNACVAAAEGADFLAFIDDDNTLEPGWLKAALDAMETLPHDAFFGAIKAVFEDDTLATPMVRQVFSRGIPADSGADLYAMGPEKTPGIAISTGNSIVRMAALKSLPHLFDPQFGRGGGEDYDLFCRMQRAGFRFAWLPAALCGEYVPAGRCDPAYLTERFFAGGQAFVRMTARTSEHPELTRWYLRLRALAQAGVLAAQYPLRQRSGGHALLEHRYAWASMLGKLSFGDILPIYARHSGPKQ